LKTAAGAKNVFAWSSDDGVTIDIG
jgi:hypothetical protein